MNHTLSILRASHTCRHPYGRNDSSEKKQSFGFLILHFFFLSFEWCSMRQNDHSLPYKSLGLSLRDKIFSIKWLFSLFVLASSLSFLRFPSFNQESVDFDNWERNMKALLSYPFHQYPWSVMLISWERQDRNSINWCSAYPQNRRNMARAHFACGLQLDQSYSWRRLMDLRFRYSLHLYTLKRSGSNIFLEIHQS